MADPRPILYGVSDYAEIRKANAWFVDRTAKIRDLEKVRYALFLRPRRFGKSLFCAILEAYYNVRYTARFEELFGGTAIGENPTEERNKYLVLRFDFSAVKKNLPEVQKSFEFQASLRCDAFARRYAKDLPEGVANRILAAPDCNAKMGVITTGLSDSGHKLYVIIDEYDNFTNTILAENGLEAYGRLCHGEGFFKQFFADLKTATSGADAPVSRLFITGVSPVTMDDVTSGFNIGTNISLDSVFADLTGFRHDDLHEIAQYYGKECGIDAPKAETVCRDWFDNYRFGSLNAPQMANTTLVLNFFDKVVRTGTWPDDYIDENLRTDYAKIRHLVTLNSRLNGNFGVLESLIESGGLSERLKKSFQAQELSQKENFTSLLYWFGLTTITGGRFGKTSFGLPNETMKKLAADMIPAAYADIHKIDGRVQAINDGLCVFADNGDWRDFVDVLCEIVRENFRVRDSIDGEKTVQSTIVALLVAAAGPYFVNHEGEAGGGFYDIALKPRLLDWPDIAHAALIELKYLKPGDPDPAPDALAEIKAKAIEQLDRYASDPALAAEWRLAPPEASKVEGRKVEGRKIEGPTVQPSNLSTFQPPVERDSAPGAVALHRLVLVFKGGECVLSEEV